jgi:hypothetical protein
MKLVKPIPFKEAIEKIGSKTIIGSQLNSAEWSEVPLALRERAFFSSRVESARFLQRAQDAVGDFLTGNREDAPDPEDGTMLKMGSRQQFVRDMQAFALSNGMGPLDPDLKGGLQDITSEKRLSLIFDTQTRQGQDYGYWKQGMDADVLNEFPAQRFIRVEHVHEPRDWHKLFEDGVWLKTDLDAWIRINQDFGVPWGPWGWGCGHDVEDVDRDEAEELGLIEPGVRPEPADTRFNDRLEASARGLDAGLLQELRSAFGDKVVITEDAIRWNDDPTPPKPEPEPKPEPPKPNEPEPPTPKPPPQPESNEETATARLDQALEAAGVKGKDKVTAVEMTALREELKELVPAKAKDVIATMHGKQHGTLTKANMEKEVQAFLDLLPPSLVAKLPKLHVSADIFDARGDYRMGGRVRAHISLNNDAEETHRVLFHELMHWVHLEGPKWYRDAIAKHFEARTAGEKVVELGLYGVSGKKDKWYEVYAGRIYSGYPLGTEVPTRYIEWLTLSPEKMARMWNEDALFRETMLIVLRILF